MKRINLLGLILCIIYVLIICLSLLGAYLADGDFKGRFVMLQLPIALQLSLLDLLGLDLWIRNWSWLIGYAVIVPMTLFFLYYVGFVVTRLWYHSKLLAMIAAISPLFIVLFWHPLRILFRTLFH